MLRITPYIILLLASSFVPGIVAADEGSKRVQELASQVAALKAEVTELTKVVESLKFTQPTVTMLMPNFAERFHVMHYAGEAEDWAVASHELLGLMHLVKIMQQVNPEKGAMTNGFLGANFKQLDSAIEH